MRATHPRLTMLVSCLCRVLRKCSLRLPQDGTSIVFRFTRKCKKLYSPPKLDLSRFFNFVAISILSEHIRKAKRDA